MQRSRTILRRDHNGIIVETRSTQHDRQQPSLSKSASGQGQGSSASSASASLERRIAVIEEGMEVSDDRLDDHALQIKVLLAQFSIINEWIKNKFGVPIINEECQHFKSINGDCDEIDEIISSLRNTRSPPESSETMIQSSTNTSTSQETQTELVEQVLTLKTTDLLKNFEIDPQDPVKVVNETMSLSLRHPAEKRKVIVVTDESDASSDSGSDEDNEELENQSDDEGADSDVSDLMIDVIMGKTIKNTDKEKLNKFYGIIEDIRVAGPVIPAEFETGRRSEASPCKQQSKASPSLSPARQSCVVLNPESKPQSPKAKLDSAKIENNNCLHPLRVRKSPVKDKKYSNQIARKKKFISHLRMKKRSRSKQACNKILRCKYCHKKFRAKGIWYHLQTMHIWSKPFKCSFCKAQFRSRREAGSHALIFHRKSVLGTKRITRSHSRKKIEKKRVLSANKPPSDREQQLDDVQKLLLQIPVQDGVVARRTRSATMKSIACHRT